MSLNRNLEQVEMTLLKSEGQERTLSGAKKDIWEVVKIINLKVSNLKVKKVIENAMYMDIEHIGVTRELDRLDIGKYRLEGECGLYEVLDIKKMGAKTIINFKLIKGDGDGKQTRI